MLSTSFKSTSVPVSVPLKFADCTWSVALLISIPESFLFHLITFLFNHQSWFLDFPQHSWTSLWSLRFEYYQNLWIQSTDFVLQVLRVAGLINPPIPHTVTFTCLETRIFLHITSTLYISLQKQKQKFHAWYHTSVSFTVFYGYVHAPYRLLILL